MILGENFEVFTFWNQTQIISR